MDLELTPVPPPPEPPHYAAARDLGIPPCLRAEARDYAFRCAHCHQRAKPGTPIVWVPDGATSRANLEEEARLNAYNGEHSGWCLPCARKKFGEVTLISPRVTRWIAGVKKALGIAP
jgi:hypothetical protein